MWSDPIADMLTRVRNATRAHHKEVKVPASNVKAGIAEVLKREGYIRDYERIDDGQQGVLRLELKYGRLGEQIITEIKRSSRPGRRDYRGVEDLPEVLNGLGIAIVSTSHGVLSGKECKEKNIGGEFLCTVC